MPISSEIRNGDVSCEDIFLKLPGYESHYLVSYLVSRCTDPHSHPTCHFRELHFTYKYPLHCLLVDSVSVKTKGHEAQVPLMPGVPQTITIAGLATWGCMSYLKSGITGSKESVFFEE